jgi:predicted transcriptional regulator
MIKIQPAPILIESSETATNDIINLMIEKKTSYVLLTNQANEISGIFTDRDVLRLFSTLKQETNAKLAVLNYMNKPVITLSLSEIHLAPKTMVDNNIRHVPIIHEKNVVGIVTADSIFKSVIASLPRNVLSISSIHDFEQVKTIGIISPDGNVFSLFKNLFQNESQVILRRVWYNDIQSKNALRTLCKTCNLLLLDIDDIPIKNWLTILAEFNSIEHVPDTFLVLDTKKHPNNVIERVHDLKPIRWLHFFYKPLNITSIISETNEVLLKK